MRFTYPSFAVLLFFSIAVAPSCNGKKKKEAAVQQRAAPKPQPKVDGYVVETRSLSQSIEVPGSLVADESTEIHPEVSGKITGLYVREGVYVNKGALLAKLYDADLQAQKRKLQVQLKIAQTTEDRYQKLASIGGISKQDYELTGLQVSNLRADLDVIQTSIAKTEVRAPFGGKLGLKDISPGAYVTPATVISVIQKTSSLRLDFNIPEKYSSQIKKGQPVNFTVESNSKNYAASIKATESGIQETTRTLTIRALVKGDQQGLVPGGFAKVKLDFAPDEAALMIPTQAVIPQARGKKVALFKAGKASFVDVVTGIRDSSMVQITDGLAKGDTVIITGLLSLKPEDKVSIKKITNKSR